MAGRLVWWEKGQESQRFEAPGVTLCVTSGDGPTTVVPRDTEGVTWCGLCFECELSPRDLCVWIVVSQPVPLFWEVVTPL